METRKVNITIPLLEMWFRKYNIMYFGGKLPMPTLRLSSRSAKTLGNCRTDWRYDMNLNKVYRFTITINTRYDRSEHWYQNTFIHEMIHEWQMVTYGYADHKATFKAKADEINRKGGWNISRLSDITKEDGISRAAIHRRKTEVSRICIMDSGRTERFVACLADSASINEITRGFKKYKPSFYLITNQSTFADYTRTGRGRNLRGKLVKEDSKAYEEIMSSVEPLV